MWNLIISLTYSPEENPVSKFNNVTAWYERVNARDSVKKILAIRKEMMDAEGLGANALPTDVSVIEIAEKINK